MKYYSFEPYHVKHSDGIALPSSKSIRSRWRHIIEMLRAILVLTNLLNSHCFKIIISATSWSVSPISVQLINLRSKCLWKLNFIKY